MPPPPPPLVDELVEEVLLRLPPDSPASLVRAGLVCKRWWHLVSDPVFHRRFIDFHGRAPPMLGFMIYSRGATRFVPTSASGGLQPLMHANNLCGLRACDSRHGRVLLRNTGAEYHKSIRIVVWNPIIGEQLELPEPSLPRHPLEWTAAVLCAAAAAGGACECDHLDCHCGPFIVALAGTTCSKNLVCIYDSEAGAWSEPAFTWQSGGPVILDSSVRSILVGNALYFVLHGSAYYSDVGNDDHHRKFCRYNYRNILEYNLVTRSISVVQLPRASTSFIREPFEPIELTTMEDGRLGFVRVEHYSTLCLWSREVDEPAGWVRRRTIQLAHHLLPSSGDDPWLFWTCWRYLVGSAEGVGTVFLTLKDELFTVDVWSGRVTKVYTDRGSSLTVPYVSFCTPAFPATSSLNGPRTEYLK